MNDLGLSLFAGAARVTVLAFFGLVIACSLKRRGPSAVVLATFWTLSSLVVVTLLSLSPWPRFWGVDLEAVRMPAARVAIRPAETPLPHAVASEAAAPRLGGSDMRLADFAAAFRRALRQPGAGPAAQGTFSAWSWPAWVSLGLLSAVGLGLGRLAFALRSVRLLRCRAAAIADRAVVEEVDCLRAALGCVPAVELRESLALTTAATIGWRRPVILLPAGWRSWSDDERTSALAHELAHVRAGDYGSGVWAHLCLCLHIYHPLAHWLVARLRLEQELAADALAAGVSGGSRAYLESLARLALRRPGPVESRPRAGLWPARPFLPTRGTLLRRIEMLRDPKANLTRTDPLSWPGRVATIAALAVVGLALVGLRGPAGARAQQAEQRAAAGPVQDDPSDVFDLSRAPAETVLAIAGKPAALLRRPEFKPLADLLVPQSGTGLHTLGIKPDEVESVVGFMMRGFLAAPGSVMTRGAAPVFMIRTGRPFDWQKINTALAAKSDLAQFEGLQIVRWKAMQTAVVRLDDRTMAVGPEFALRQVIAARKGGPIKHVWDEAWSKVKKGQVALAVDASAFAPLLVPGNTPPGQMTALAASAGPLVEKASAYAVGIDLAGGRSVDLVAVASSDDAAQNVADTLKALAVLGMNALDSLRRQAPPNPEQGRALRALVGMVEPLLKNARTEVKGSMVELQSATGQDVAGLVAPLAAMFAAAQVASQDAQRLNHMREIMLAMHNYHVANNHFPPAVLLGEDGKTPHSWRVALLPYLNQPELYNQYHFDEPWDSAANRLVLAQMPAVYRHPTTVSSEVVTAYVAPVNAGSIFPPGGTGMKRDEIFDGTSNTIMIVEAKTGIPWTKPDDLVIDGDLMQFGTPAPPVPAYSNAGFVAGLADGAARVISNANSPGLLKALFTRAGGEAFDWSAALPPTGPPH